MLLKFGRKVMNWKFEANWTMLFCETLWKYNPGQSKKSSQILWKFVSHNRELAFTLKILNSRVIFLLYNENHGQWKRYKRHIANVSITPVIIISALQIELQWSCYRFLLVTGEKSAVKKCKTRRAVSVVTSWCEAYIATWLSWIRADSNGTWCHEWGMKLCYVDTYCHWR